MHIQLHKYKIRECNATKLMTEIHFKSWREWCIDHHPKTKKNIWTMLMMKQDHAYACNVLYWYLSNLCCAKPYCPQHMQLEESSFANRKGGNSTQQLWLPNPNITVQRFGKNKEWKHIFWAREILDIIEAKLQFFTNSKPATCLTHTAHLSISTISESNKKPHSAS